MKPSAILMIIAVLAAGLTAMLAKSWLDNHTAAPANDLSQTIEVLVVARPVAAGTALQIEDLRYDRWPISLSSARLIIRTANADGRAAFAGQIVRRALGEGEPFSAEDTAKHDLMGVMAAMLSPGMRAISIPITNPSAVSGFITPGDRVDVVVATDLAHTLENNHPPAGDKLLRFAAETLLSNIKVLAIDQQIIRSQDGGAVQGKTATVEVTPKQVESLTVASQMGTLQLVLHGSAEDDPTVVGHEFSGDIETSSALRSLLANRPAPGNGPRPHGPIVRVNRAGVISQEEFVQ